MRVILQFKKNTGCVSYLSLNKKYEFNYSFKNDSIIKIWTKNYRPQLHVIKKLNKDALELRPYPIKIREAVELIDVIDFTKAK